MAKVFEACRVRALAGNFNGSDASGISENLNPFAGGACDHEEAFSGIDKVISSASDLVALKN